MTATADPVGFIGLGQIGEPMAMHLTAWPGGLVVHDVRPDACDRVVAAGAVRATSPAEVARTATVISVMVRDDAQVTEVVAGEDGVLQTATPGTVVAVHSTIAASTAEDLARTAAAAGVAIVDAPVSGGALGAHAGRLAVLAGGGEEDVARCRGPFAHFADLVVRFGPVGAGTRAKIARNLVTFVSFAAVGESLRLAEAAGLPLHPLGEVIRHSDAVTGGPGAIALRDRTGALDDDDPLATVMRHTRELAEKDLQLAADLADRLGVPAPLTALAADLLDDALGVPHDDRRETP